MVVVDYVNGLKQDMGVGVDYGPRQLYPGTDRRAAFFSKYRSWWRVGQKVRRRGCGSALTRSTDRGRGY